MPKPQKGEPCPPVNAKRHRRWRLWYDLGIIGGIESAWYARSPAGETIMAKEYDGVLAGINTVEDGIGRDTGDRLEPCNPERDPGPFMFWTPDVRILDLS